jgi:hypothetical protein
MTSTDTKRPVSAGAENPPLNSDRSGGQIGSEFNSRRGAAQELVAAIDTGHAIQLRIFISRWRYNTKLEIRPYSATVPQVFMPCGPGVSLPPERVPDLIEALKAVLP